MTAVRKNYDIPALRRLDVAHHLPAQQDYKLIEDMEAAKAGLRAVLGMASGSEGENGSSGQRAAWRGHTSSLR